MYYDADCRDRNDRSWATELECAVRGRSRGDTDPNEDADTYSNTYTYRNSDANTYA